MSFLHDFYEDDHGASNGMGAEMIVSVLEEQLTASGKMPLHLLKGPGTLFQEWENRVG